MMRTVNQFSLHPILEIFSQKSFHNSFHLFSHKSAKTSFITWILLFNSHNQLAESQQNSSGASWRILSYVCHPANLKAACATWRQNLLVFLKTNDTKLIISYIDWNWTVKNYHFLRHNIWLMLSASSQKSYSWFTSIFFFFFK